MHDDLSEGRFENITGPIARTGLESADAVLPVSLLVSTARLLIERNLGLRWVSGEISNFTRAGSGHCYFNLKDAQAQVRCVMFRLRAQHVAFPLRDGLSVEVRATPSIYEARGEFQLNVDNMRLAGVGALYERFARLKAKLDAAGWFAVERKRALPAYARVIGIVTSPRAAALRDILTTLSRRWPAARIILYPAAVQGFGAAAEIAQAIRIANERAEVDVLIVGRGGGSIEDLWAFNEEIVAQAVFASLLPIVSGVGHETGHVVKAKPRLLNDKPALLGELDPNCPLWRVLHQDYQAVVWLFGADHVCRRDVASRAVELNRRYNLRSPVATH